MLMKSYTCKPHASAISKNEVYHQRDYNQLYVLISMPLDETELIEFFISSLAATITQKGT